MATEQQYSGPEDNGDFEHPDYDGMVDNEVVNEPEQEEEEEVAQEGELPVEDNQEGEEEEEGDEEEEEVPQPREKKRDSSKKLYDERLAESKRIQHQLAQQLAQRDQQAQYLQAELERQTMFSNATVQTAFKHYEEAANQRLQMAEQAKRRAFDSGDYDEQLKADRDYFAAVSEINILQQKKAEQTVLQQPHYQNQNINQNPQYQQQYQQPQQAPHSSQQQMANAEGWVQRNPWFNARSDSYDHTLAQEVESYCNNLDYNLELQGLTAKRYSPEYLETVDNYVKKLREHKAKSNGGNLNMKSGPNVVSRVRSQGSVSGNRPSGTHPPLTLQQKEWARNFGMTDAQYVKSIANLEKLGKMKDGKIIRQF